MRWALDSGTGAGERPSPQPLSRVRESGFRFRRHWTVAARHSGAMHARHRLWRSLLPPAGEGAPKGRMRALWISRQGAGERPSRQPLSRARERGFRFLRDWMGAVWHNGAMHVRHRRRHSLLPPAGEGAPKGRMRALLIPTQGAGRLPSPQSLSCVRERGFGVAHWCVRGALSQLQGRAVGDRYNRPLSGPVVIPAPAPRIP